jgi:hypothetical protein
MEQSTDPSPEPAGRADCVPFGVAPSGSGVQTDGEYEGFLVHLQCTYPALTPYLKGLHLTIDSWWPGRDTEGWKDKQWSSSEGYWDDSVGSWVSWDNAPSIHPEYVHPVPRYSSDLDALSQLLSGSDPPLRYIRNRKIHVAIYGFADASASGFGSTFDTSEGIAYTYGIWGRDRDRDSPNFRELSNLVFTLKWHCDDGTLIGSEVFLFTDNVTVESAFYKGNTPSKCLFSLVLRLCALEMRG